MIIPDVRQATAQGTKSTLPPVSLDPSPRPRPRPPPLRSPVDEPRPRPRPRPRPPPPADSPVDEADSLAAACALNHSRAATTAVAGMGERSAEGKKVSSQKVRLSPWERALKSGGGGGALCCRGGGGGSEEGGGRTQGEGNGPSAELKVTRGATSFCDDCWK